MIYGKWSVQASKQASKQTYTRTHGCNEVTLVWSSLRLAPINMHIEYRYISTAPLLVNCNSILLMPQAQYTNLNLNLQYLKKNILGQASQLTSHTHHTGTLYITVWPLRYRVEPLNNRLFGPLVL